MNARVFVRQLITMLLASPAFAPCADAAGKYELTKDTGAYVWNNYPKPGDEALWSGAKDAEGFATGEGVLTWLKSGKFVSRYTGTMVRGRLHGSISNEDASGKKFRGTFIEGLKSADWSEITATTPAVAVSSPPPLAVVPPGESLDAMLKRRDAEITAAYQACLAAFEGPAKEQLRVAQRAWIDFSNKDEAAAAVAAARRGMTRAELLREAAREVEARTEQLRTFFSLPNQDLAACRRDLEGAEREMQTVYQQSWQTLAPDEQAKLQQAQEAWVQFREKSAASHSADPSGRAPVWNRVVLTRRRTEDLQDLYVRRFLGQTAPSPSPLAGGQYASAPTPPPASVVTTAPPLGAASPAAAGSVAPQAATPAMQLAVASSAEADARAKMVVDFKEEIGALYRTASTSGFATFRSLNEVKPLPQPTSDAITRSAERAREFRSKVGYSDALRDTAAETAALEALTAYDQALRAAQSSDAPAAELAVTSLLRRHAQPAAEDHRPLWQALNSFSALCDQSRSEATRRVGLAKALADKGKTGEAIKEYEAANGVFPDPKTTAAIKKLREESLGL